MPRCGNNDSGSNFLLEADYFSFHTKQVSFRVIIAEQNITNKQLHTN